MYLYFRFRSSKPIYGNTRCLYGYMSPDLRQSWESTRIWTIPFENLPISAISLQSRISSSPRGVTTSYFARNRLRVVCSISGLLSAVEGCPDNSLTPWPHRLSPRRDPRSDHLRSSFWASLCHEIRRFLHKKYPCANFGDFPHDFHCTARISDVETGYLQNRPTHGSCWVE